MRIEVPREPHEPPKTQLISSDLLPEQEMVLLTSMRKKEEGMMIPSINVRLDELLALMNKRWMLLSVDEKDGCYSACVDEEDRDSKS